MLFSYIKKLNKLRKARKLRSGMRGYRLLKKHGRLAVVNNIKGSLSKTGIRGTKIIGEDLLFGVSRCDQSLALRQFLLTRIETSKFNMALLSSFGSKKKLIFPIHGSWQNTIKGEGVQVNKLMCSIWWALVVVLYWYRGVVTIISYIYRHIDAFFITKKQKTYSKYAYFSGLLNCNVPTRVDSHDIITWYMSCGVMNSGIDLVCHNVKSAKSIKIKNTIVRYKKYELPSISKLIYILYFILWGAASISVSALLLIFGKWKYALLLSEYAKVKVVKLSDPSSIACQYLFNMMNYRHIYRPMWTYEVEEKGADVFFYFYSTNIEIFKTKYGYEKQHIWSLISWSKYLVWDKYQKDFINRMSSYKKDIQIVGPVWFSSGNAFFQEFPKKSISVFDVSPVRDSCYQMLCAPNDYYTPSVINLFLEDIRTAFYHKDVTILLKKKRNDGNITHRSYVRFTNSLVSREDFVLIDPTVPALDVVEKSKIVISLPFTSTAIIAKNAGVSSVFYDPSKKIQKDDLAAHGVPIISGIKELKTWVNSITI